ncbi:MAG: sugar ABC transporter ATP-binding protein, partial [Silicimonas sp.]|nr:sugar ABC transporter ATP-binding protein [Silicimonas sp.]
MSPVLELRNVTKVFGQTRALSGFSLKVHPGTIHAIVGENGAGKSTMIKIMTGIHGPTSGEVLVDGQPVTLRSTRDAQEKGIAAIYQEPMVFPDLDVTENIFISHLDRPAWMDWSAMREEADAIISRLGVSLDAS